MKVITRYQKRKDEDLAVQQSAFVQVQSAGVAKMAETAERSKIAPDFNTSAISQGNVLRNIPFIPYLFNKPIVQSSLNTLPSPYQMPSFPFCAYIIQPLFLPFPNNNTSIFSHDPNPQAQAISPNFQIGNQDALPH